MLKRYVFKCCLNIVTLGEHLIPSGKVFHSVAAAVSMYECYIIIFIKEVERKIKK